MFLRLLRVSLLFSRTITRIPDAASIYEVFFCLALSAFFRLLLIMTTERKLPTTVVPRIRRMTGMRMAQTRGRKRE